LATQKEGQLFPQQHLKGKYIIIPKAGFTCNQPQTEQNQPSALPLLNKLQTEDFSEYTIDATAKHLKRLAEHCNLNNPETVLKYVSELNVSNGYKLELYKAYRHLARFYKIAFQIPKKLRAESRPVKLPTNEKLNAFINYARTGLALKLRISKYGLRPIEVCRLKAKDIDTDHKTIIVETAKHGIPRQIPIEQPLASTLKAYIERKQLQPNDYLFQAEKSTPEKPIHQNPKYYGKTFIAMRTRLAKTMNDPTIKEIKLYHFRHYYGTMIQIEYHDVPTTAYRLGHRDWKNTQIYVDLAKILELGEDGEHYVVKVAHTEEEEMKLIEANFTFVNKRENPYTAFYRKRK
jgi:integrase